MARDRGQTGPGDRHRSALVVVVVVTAVARRRRRPGQQRCAGESTAGREYIRGSVAKCAGEGDVVSVGGNAEGCGVSGDGARFLVDLRCAHAPPSASDHRAPTTRPRCSPRTSIAGPGNTHGQLSTYGNHLTAAGKLGIITTRQVTLTYFQLTVDHSNSTLPFKPNRDLHTRRRGPTG